MSGAFRSGYVAIVGRPNTGKSTLVNTLVGQKISITTPRPQTTRNRILGIVRTSVAEIVLIDTPGLHENERRALNRVMNRAAQHALAEADAIIWMSEAGRFNAEDAFALDEARRRGGPIVAVLNKMDRVRPTERLLGYIDETAKRGDFSAIVPVSARRGTTSIRCSASSPSSCPSANRYSMRRRLPIGRSGFLRPRLSGRN